MNNKKAEELLDKFSIIKTELRIHLVTLFLKKNRAYSQSEIINALNKSGKSTDRVSIYRNLNQLKTSGIIHEIENNQYVCCSHDCKQHAHILLYCKKCKNHNELKDHDKINLFFETLGNFNFLSIKKAVFLKGVCKACAK